MFTIDIIVIFHDNVIKNQLIVEFITFINIDSDYDFRL